MAKSVLSLDPGTITGWCVIHVNADGNSIASSTWNFQPGRFDGAGMRTLRFRKILQEILTDQKIDAVYYEEVRRHLGADAARVYGSLFGVITSLCEELEIPYEGVPVGTIKKFWTNKGNASKELMIETAHKHGYVNVTDDNEADAIALAHYAHWLNEESESPALVPNTSNGSMVLS